MLWQDEDINQSYSEIITDKELYVRVYVYVFSPP